MPKKPYIPNKNAEKETWATTYKAKIATDGPTCGLSAAEVTAQENAAQGIIDSVHNIDAADTTHASAVANAKNSMKSTISIIRAGVKRMKTHGGYTTGIGQNLGIIGEDPNIDLATSKPELKISKVPTGYEIKFNLLDFFDGVHIYRKRKTAAGFSYLATDTSSPYIDTDPMEDGTQYEAFFLLEDDEVGQPSDIIEVKL